MILQRTRQGIAGFAGIPEDDKRLGLHEPVAIVSGDHGGLEHVEMGEQRAFDLEGGYVESGYLQHVVPPAAIDEIALFILDVLVPRSRPLAEECRTRLLAVVPIHDRARRSAHEQFAELAFPNGLAAIANELHV